MTDAYQGQQDARAYLDFLNSENGQIQQKILADAILLHLPKNPQAKILDAACGPGWLAKKLADKYPGAEGFDASEKLIAYAKKSYKGINFEVADVTAALSYPANSFDTVVFNMAAPDIADLEKAYANLFAALKPAGQLLVTIPNPYYSYPAAEWKRGFWEFLLGKNPALKIKRPFWADEKIERAFGGKKIGSNHYPLPHYINTARKSGFTLVRMEELRSESDSKKFDFNYTFFRYPLILLLEFAKPN